MVRPTATTAKAMQYNQSNYIKKTYGLEWGFGIFRYKCTSWQCILYKTLIHVLNLNIDTNGIQFYSLLYDIKIFGWVLPTYPKSKGMLRSSIKDKLKKHDILVMQIRYEYQLCSYNTKNRWFNKMSHRSHLSHGPST